MGTADAKICQRKRRWARWASYETSQEPDYTYMMYVQIEINKDTPIIAKWYSGLKRWHQITYKHSV
jgi:hypothetical protein